MTSSPDGPPETISLSKVAAGPPALRVALGAALFGRYPEPDSTLTTATSGVATSPIAA
jgi:hypothetical protein